MVHEQFGILHTEHFRHRRSENIGVEQTDLVTLAGKCHGKVAGNGRFAYTALARTHSDDVLHTGERLDGGLRCLGPCLD